MRVLDRKLWREFKSSYGLLTAIISIIVVGVLCFVALTTTYLNLQEAKGRYYRQCRMADFSIELKKAPLAELDAVAKLSGVTKIRTRIQFHATVDLKGVVEPLNGLVLSLPDRQKKVIDDIVLTRGGYFTDRRKNEVIVNEAFAEAHNLMPGQWIHLVLNNRRQKVFIVGTAISSEFVYLLSPGSLVPDPESFGVFYLKRTFAEDVFDFNGAANQVLGQLSPDMREQSNLILEEAEQILTSYGVFSTTPLKDQASNTYLSSEIDGLKTFAFVTPAIFLMVAAMVLNMLLTRLAEQQRTVVGTLKALGYSNYQVFAHFLKFGLAVGVIGGVVGCFVGYWLADAMTINYRNFFEFPELDNHFYPLIHIGGLAISVLCAVAGSLRGTRSVLKLKPAEAMRPKPPRVGGAVLLERCDWIWRNLSSSWRMVIRSIVRNRVRTAAGLFAAAVGSAILVNGFMMAQASFFLVDFQFKWTQRSDIDLTFKDDHGVGALLEAAQLPGVDYVEPILCVACTFSNGSHTKKSAVIGLTKNPRLTVPRDAETRPIRIPSMGLALSSKMAEILHVKRGDMVTFKPTKGLRKPCTVPVVEIVDSYLGTAVYTDIDYLSRLIGEEFAITGVQLLTDKNPDHERQLYKELKKLPALQATNARTEMVANLEKTLIQTMMGFIGFLILFAGIVFFGSLLNTSLISLAEREREIATLRVLGYGTWQIGSMLLREGMIITVIGTLLGMPLGYALSVGTAMAYDTDVFRFPVVSTSATWIWTFALAIVFGLSVHLVVQRVINRMNWLDSLQAKE